MRIIAGEFRGRPLLAPASDTTRPITDRAKQSLFDILTPLLSDAIVYDCFAGTGSMGLECLSRGATRARFFEADRSALERLKRNIDVLKVSDRVQVIPGDLFKWFARSTPPLPEPDRADLIFLDPPYRFLREQPDALTQLAQQMLAGHLKESGIIIFRHDLADRLPLPGLVTTDHREYGGMAIDLLQRPR
jgi:16S rRNA (guanine966-N2)-methyltransferase